jgi:hypothetical protein
MAQSTAYVLSAPYSNITEASNVGIYQGTRIVYASTASQNSVTGFFADSRLTQPVYGNSTSPYTGNWYGYRLLSNPLANTSACTISTTGLVSID